MVTAVHKIQAGSPSAPSSWITEFSVYRLNGLYSGSVDEFSDGSLALSAEYSAGNSSDAQTIYSAKFDGETGDLLWDRNREDSANNNYCRGGIVTVTPSDDVWVAGIESKRTGSWERYLAEFSGSDGTTNSEKYSTSWAGAVYFRPTARKRINGKLYLTSYRTASGAYYAGYEIRNASDYSLTGVARYWSTYGAWDITADDSGNIYSVTITGAGGYAKIVKTTESTGAHVASWYYNGATAYIALNYYGGYLYFYVSNGTPHLLKIDPSDGSVVWGKQLGTSSATPLYRGFVIDDDGNSILAFNESGDKIICSIDTDGNVNWATKHVTAMGSNGYSVQHLHSDGSLIVAGTSYLSSAGHFILKMPNEGGLSGTYGLSTFSDHTLSTAASAIYRVNTTTGISTMFGSGEVWSNLTVMGETTGSTAETTYEL